jgi:hypothetical protein
VTAEPPSTGVAAIAEAGLERCSHASTRAAPCTTIRSWRDAVDPGANRRPCPSTSRSCRCPDGVRRRLVPFVIHGCRPGERLKMRLHIGGGPPTGPVAPVITMRQVSAAARWAGAVRNLGCVGRVTERPQHADPAPASRRRSRGPSNGPLRHTRPSLPRWLHPRSRVVVRGGPLVPARSWPQPVRRAPRRQSGHRSSGQTTGRLGVPLHIRSGAGAGTAATRVHGHAAVCPAHRVATPEVLRALEEPTQ